MDLTILNDKQLEAVNHVNGPALVIAGAGSGKTRVLTHRIANLIFKHGVSPYRILSITFTNKAANEMRERVEELINNDVRDMWIGTFHGVCVRILRRHIEKLGYDRSFVIFDADDQKVVIKESISDLQLNTNDFDVNSIRSLISQQKNNRINPDLFLKENSGDYRSRKIAEIYQLYEKKLKKSNGLDFDDLIVKTIDLFERHEDVLNYYRQQFSYILVDEYQDTNRVQYLLVKMLGKNKSENENVFVVGDEDQSIYGWRGADIRNILGFEKDFPDARIIKMERNYRSSQNILEAANKVISHNTQRMNKDLWTEDKKGDKIQLYQANSEKAEALHIAERIYNEKNIHKTSYEDIAVLVRTRAQTRSIEERFVMEGIPYRIVGGQEFYGRKEIKDLMAYLKLVQNNHENYSFMRVVNVPKRGIGKKTIEHLQNISDEKGLSLMQSVEALQAGEISKKAWQELGAFRKRITDFTHKSKEATLYDLIEEIFIESGYRGFLEKDKTIEGRARLENVQEFFSKVKDYEEKNAEDSLEDFIAHISLLTDIEKTEDSEGERVTIMTVHSAKGLEFDVVVIAGLEEKMFPISRDNDEDLEEERRLFYVAITRAKKRLYLTYAQDRMIYGSYESRKKSRFLDELPQKIMNANTKHHEIGITRKEEDVFTGGYVTKPPQESEKSHKEGTGPIFSPGERIEHKKWGLGTVVQVKGDEITVAFKEKGIKVMMMPYAPIEKV
jgi:DNA helicase-2/ATP-dependent DNA helicase PcrA